MLRLDGAIPGGHRFGANGQREAAGQVHVDIPYLMARKRSRKSGSWSVPMKSLGLRPPNWLCWVFSHSLGLSTKSATSWRMSGFSSGNNPWADATGAAFFLVREVMTALLDTIDYTR